MKHYLLSMLIICCSCVVYAQDKPVISKNPVANEAATRRDLFELDTLNINYYFRANLPGDNFLVIEFDKLSYWPGAGQLNDMFAAALTAVQQVTDSAPNTGASRRIDMHIPIKGTPVLMSVQEHNEHSSITVLADKNKAALKLGMDTIRILKTYSEIKSKTGKELVRVQYTFILKDLEQVKTLAANAELVSNTDKTFDELVQARKKIWHKPDMWNHSMSAVYDPQQNQQEKQVVTDIPSGFKKGFETEAYIGAALFRNTLCPFSNIGYSYQWRSNENESIFIRASLSGLSIFERLGNEVQADGLAFINAEFGTRYNKSNTLLPVYKTSIGLGYKIASIQDDPTLKGKHVFNLFFDYSLSRSVTVLPGLYVIDTKPNAQIFAAISLAVQLL